MNSSKRPRFTESELEALKLWSMPNVFGEEGLKESAPVELEGEPTPILTVDEIEAMQNQAYDEAFAQGKEQGFQQGFDEGLKKGYEENVHLLQSQAATLAILLESLSEPFKRLDEEVEKELVKLAIGMAAQIIRREIKLDPGQIVGVVREAIQVLPLASQKISLKLHPEDAELVRSALALDEMSTSWGIVEDPLITRGGCEVDTDISHVDATVEHRLAAVIATMLGGERERDKAAVALSSLEVEPASKDSYKGDVESRQEQRSPATEINVSGDAVEAAGDSKDDGMHGTIAEDEGL